MFGNWLKNKRMERGLSRRELGVAAGISDSTVYQIERNKIKKPPKKRLEGFAKVLKLPLKTVQNALEGVRKSAKVGLVSGLLVAPNLNLFGKDELEQKVLQAVELVQYFEPHALSFNPLGYSCEFSGGKDSIVVEDIMRKSGVKHTTSYSSTTIDPPELIHFMRDYYPDVNWRVAKANFFSLVEKKGLPIRQSRWCCDVYKERNATDAFVVTGVRAAESVRRSKRRQFESCGKYADRRFLHPIFHFSDREVWEYIHREDLPYCDLYDKGFQRLGCVGCPIQGCHGVKRDFDKWPRFKKLWVRSAQRYYDRRKTADAPWTKKIDSGQAFFDWWLSGQAMPKTFVNELGLTDAKGFFV